MRELTWKRRDLKRVGAGREREEKKGGGESVGKAIFGDK